MPLYEAKIAQLVEPLTEKPGTILMRVQVPQVWQGIFLRQLPVQTLLRWHPYQCLDTQKYCTHWQEWVALLWQSKLPTRNNEVQQQKIKIHPHKNFLRNKRRKQTTRFHTRKLQQFQQSFYLPFSLFSSALLKQLMQTWLERWGAQWICKQYPHPQDKQSAASPLPPKTEILLSETQPSKRCSCQQRSMLTWMFSRMLAAMEVP